MAEPEIWKPIPHWEGYYEASSDGRIRALSRMVYKCRDGRPFKCFIRGRILRPKKRKGYLFYILSRDGERFEIAGHRLVCAAFHGGPTAERNNVAHGDGDPSNNRASNLRWATAQENSDDKIIHGRTVHGNRNGRAVVNWDIVRQIRADKTTSQRQLARKFGVSASQIRNIQKGLSWNEGPIDFSYLHERDAAPAKLTKADVLHIRKNANIGAKALAAIYNVHPLTITAVIKRKTWANV